MIQKMPRYGTRIEVNGTNYTTRTRHMTVTTISAPMAATSMTEIEDHIAHTWIDARMEYAATSINWLRQSRH